MVFPLYLYFNPIELKQFPITLHIFPSIHNDFSVHTQLSSCVLHIFAHFDAFLSNNCIQNYAYGIFRLSLLVQIWKVRPLKVSKSSKSLQLPNIMFYQKLEASRIKICLFFIFKTNCWELTNPNWHISAKSHKNLNLPPRILQCKDLAQSTRMWNSPLG